MICSQFADVAGCVRSFMLARNVDTEFLNLAKTDFSAPT